MPFSFGKLKAKRVCDLLIALTFLGNAAYILYYREFLYNAWTGRSEETSSQADRHSRLADVRDFHVKSPITKRSSKVSSSRVDGQSRDNISQPCPQEPPALVGVLSCECQKLALEDLLNKHPDVELGGRIRPLECRPAQRTALIIPFRESHECLHILINQLVPILKRQLVDVTVFVIEQTSESQFNRAALQNVGFLEAQKAAPFDCFIFHDVEMVPLNDRVMYRCGPAPTHFVVSIQLTNGNPKPLYENYIGGVIAFTRDQYRVINGNSNLYFGWGGDDDDLHARIVHKQLTIVRPDAKLAKYGMLDDEPQKIIAENPYRFKLLESATRRQDMEGLNTCKYKVNFVRRSQLFSWVNVSLNTTQVLMTAPAYVLQEIQPDLKAKVKQQKIRNTCG